MAVYLATTRAGSEFTALRNILQQGRYAYLPLISVAVWAGRGKPRKIEKRPLFPRYLFVISPDQQWRFLTGTIGVLSVVMRGGAPDTVPDRVIDELWARQVNGVVELPDKADIEVGAKGTVSVGPFASFPGLYAGMKDSERVRVLLMLFGREQEVVVDRKGFEVT